MRIIQVISAFYIVAVFVWGSIGILSRLWDKDEDVSVHLSGVLCVALAFAILVCAITTLGAA